MKEYYYRHLPHWQPHGALLFVTFRLKNSLPMELIVSLQEEREREKILLQQLPESELARQISLEQRRYFDKWDGYLDKAQYGPRWLAQPEIPEWVPFFTSLPLSINHADVAVVKFLISSFTVVPVVCHTIFRT